MNRNHRLDRKARRRRGASLVELSIVAVMIGIMASMDSLVPTRH